MCVLEIWAGEYPSLGATCSRRFAYEGSAMWREMLLPLESSHEVLGSSISCEQEVVSLLIRGACFVLLGFLV